MQSLEICKVCNSEDVHEFLNLGAQPNGNKLLSHPLQELSETRLAYSFCQSCKLIQQTSTFSDVQMYQDHPYLTLHNKQYLDDLENFTEVVIYKCQVEKNDLILDIGCNDGSLLEMFRSRGCAIYGVDPADTAFRYSQLKNIPVFKQFWNTQLSGWLKTNDLKPKVIVSTASFYHMNDIKNWMKAVVETLPDNNYLAVQFVSALKVIDNVNIDQFYHEHTFLHSISSVSTIAELYGLKILHIQETLSQGGSYIVIMQKTKNQVFAIESKQEFLELEDKLFTLESLLQFGDKITKLKADWNKISKRLIQRKEKLIGIGASLRGISLINFLRIDSRIFHSISDINKEKVGYWTPGSSILITDENINKQICKYYIVLAWTQKNAILSKYASILDNGGCLIFPFPQIEFYGDDHLDLQLELSNY